MRRLRRVFLIAPGRFVNVARPGEQAERRLHFVCIGQGEPTVIFESSGFSGALSSRMAREEVSALTRVCAPTIAWVWDGAIRAHR